MKIIDLHCDTLLWSVMKPEDPLEDPERQITVEKLIRGGALAQCFALFVPTDGQGSMAEQEETCYGFFRKLAENFEEAMRKHADVLLQARNAAEIRRNAAAGKISAVLTLEDGTFVAGQMSRIEEAASLGARALALTWTTENCFGYPNSDDREAHLLPLKPFGREAVEYMNDLGMIADVSHLNEGGFWDVAKISRKPFVATHSCANELVKHKRNLTDDQIRAVAESGGVIGINFYPPFVSPDRENTTIDTVVRQARYLVNVGGEDAVALGSDFDGMAEGTLDFGGFSDYAGYPAIAEALSDALGSRSAEKICSLNALRVLE